MKSPDTHGLFTAKPPPTKQNMLTARTQSQQPVPMDLPHNTEFQLISQPLSEPSETPPESLLPTMKNPDTHGLFTAKPPPTKQNMLTAPIQSQQLS